MRERRRQISRDKNNGAKEKVKSTKSPSSPSPARNGDDDGGFEGNFGILTTGSDSPDSKVAQNLFGNRIKGWKRKLFAKVFIGPLIGVIFTLGLIYYNLDYRQLQFYKFIQESNLLPDIGVLPPFLRLDSIAPFMNRDAIKHIVDFLNRMAIMEGAEEDSSYDRHGPGEKYKKMGAKAHHPVVIIPGIVSTGLEVWQGKECSDGYFRKRIWGSLNMLRLMFLDKNCWLEHMKLNPKTGMDPENVKIRAATGLEAADYFMPGYWVWSKVIESLSHIGYDHNNLILASYDWRLGFHALEERDHYFSHLKTQIEHLYNNNNAGKKAIKVALISHSMGSLVVLYFFKWIEKHHGSSWLDTHVHTFMNVGGPLLGLPRAFSSYLSGESKETAQLGELESYVLEMLFSKSQRVDLFRTWFSSYSMIPKGGDVIWGNASRSAIDSDDGSDSVISFNTPGMKNITASEAIEIIKQVLQPESRKIVDDNYSFGFREAPSGIQPLRFLEDRKYNEDRKYWSNPLEASLPAASNIKIYCMYGVSKDTERKYQYAMSASNVNASGLTGKHYEDGNIPLSLNTTANDPNINLANGIYFKDGDGSVPLLSLGLVCAHGWRQPYLNPASIPIVTREYKHQPVSMIADVRGGPLSSDHVDILGNEQMLMDVIEIVSQKTVNDNNPESWPSLKSRFYSDILNWKLPPGWI